MTAIADDFAAIAARLKGLGRPPDAPKLEPDGDQVCATCDGIGWECDYPPPGGMPIFSECSGCANPYDRPHPEIAAERKGG